MLNRFICEKYGIDYSKIYCFDTSANMLLPTHDKNLLIEKYSDPDIYREIPFDYGIERLDELSRKHEIWIKSHCLTQEIAKIKRKRLHEVCSIPDKQLDLMLITKEMSFKSKNIGSDFDIYVDDCAQHLHNSKAKHKALPNRPWNRRIHIHNCVRVDTLDDVIRYIEAYDPQ